MKEYLNKIPSEVKRLVDAAAKLSAERNEPAYLVGGFVRDLLLGVKNLDLDIVVADGISFAEELSGRIGGKLVRHKRFGTATIHLDRYSKVDVTSARSEAYPQPASLPVVARGSLRDDLFRRDFSINAMAISIQPPDFGCLVDFFGGKNDLLHRKVRVLHGDSFIDDPTRILRAIRFTCRYDFALEPNTRTLLKRAAAGNMLQKVEPQRVRDEVILLFKEPHPGRAIKQMNRLCGLDFICAKLRVNASMLNLLARLQKESQWYNTIAVRKPPVDAWLIYFMGFIAGLDTHAASAVCKHFVFRNSETKIILSVREFSVDFIRQLSSPRTEPSVVYRLLEPVSYEALLFLRGRYRNKVLRKHIQDFFCRYHDVRVSVTGHDLKELGIKPGPAYQKILNTVLDARIDGVLASKEEEIAFIRRMQQGKKG